MRRRGSSSGGFTLVELLVVIAVIALLVGLLLPTLGKTRETGFQVKCLSNMRQIITATLEYAQDYKGEIWPAADWADLDRSPDFLPGLLYDYVSGADFVTECPKNKRQNQRGGGGGRNGFGQDKDLTFDYTMFDETQGARLDLAIFARYVPPTYSTPPKLPVSLADKLIPLPALPIYVEESTFFYNDQFTEGAWGNWDQVTTRHFDGGHMAFLDGTARLMRTLPKGQSESIREAPKDFEGNDVYVSVTGRDDSWFKVSDRNQKFGWINHPN